MYRSDHSRPFKDQTHGRHPTLVLLVVRVFIGVAGATALGGAASGMAGCQGGPSTLDRKAGPQSTGSGLGDMNDIDVSVDAALARAGIAPVGMDVLPDGTRVWELRTARDEPGEVVVRVGDPEEQGGPVPVEMSCRVGRFGDPETEALILRSAAARLEQLRGRGVYRITWR